MTDFRLFGPVHLAILALVPAAAGALAALVRGQLPRGRRAAATLGVLLGTNELIWYAYRLATEGNPFPRTLPLNLCDLTLWMAVVSLLTLRPGFFEFAYLAGVGGSSMALLTPALWAPATSYPTIYFFLAHGGVVSGMLFLIWSGLSKPRPGCVWRIFAWVNAWALSVGVFNWIFGTNYMFLREKPPSVSLLDWMGPWPVYILAGEAVALVVFWLLWLPFRGGRQRQEEPQGMSS